MKSKKIIMRTTDLIMTGNLLFLMALQVTQQFAHEWIGIAMTVLFIVHHILNYKYYKTIFKGKYSFLRVFQFLISVLLFLSFVTTAVSGMVMSRYATPFMNGLMKASDARKLHMAFSYWSFVLMGVHIGLHLGLITTKFPKGVFRIILAVIMTGVSVWGFMLFLDSNTFDYMFMQTHFAFLDYSKAAWLVIVENLAMLITWAFMAYLLLLFVRALTAKKQNKDKSKKVIVTALYAVGIVVIIGMGALLHFVISGSSDNDTSGWGAPTINTPQTSKAENSETKTENSFVLNSTEVKDNYVLIKGGNFMMGSPETENWRIDDETQHKVTVSSFYIDPCETTQKEYESLMGTNPSTFKGEDLPVDDISWTDAVLFANTKSRSEGLTPAYTVATDGISWDRSANGYRLPTEAEWEYACRAGTSTPFNTQKSLDATQANFYGRYPYEIEGNYFNDSVLEERPGEYRHTTIKVGSFAPNGWGLYDCHGNVNEWCWDYYAEYDISVDADPAGAKNGTRHIYRGGGWNDFAKNMRSAYRAAGQADMHSYNLGVRLVRSADNILTGVIKAEEVVIKTGSGGNILIAYFSWGGNTRGIAQEIKKQTEADIFEISPVKTYSSDYNTVLMEAQEDQHNQARPELNDHVTNMESYDIILLGYPNWWASIPMPIASFLEEYNFSGKKIIPFCSHGGGRFGQSLTAIAKLTPNAEIGEGLSVHYSGGSSLPDDVSAWLKTNRVE